MRLINYALDIISLLKAKIERIRIERRWTILRQRGMGIGADVWLPASTWIDAEYCFLITIGDHCGFGEHCFILAHDAQMDEFLDAARIGRVTIHESCHIGARTVILPGVEIGPQTIVGANSVVTKSLPAYSVCAGNPAQVLCSLDAYLEKHRSRIAVSPQFAYQSQFLSEEDRTRMALAVSKLDGYIIGGRSAELRGEGGTPRSSAVKALSR